MIELQNVSFGYETRVVLKDLSFTIKDSESVAIMGPSGSGKSTILRLLLGLETPQSGAVLIDGQDICRLRERQKREIRKRIGMVFQDGALFDSMTVGENVGYYLIEHTKMDDEEIEERVREMLGFVGLDAEEIIDKLPEQLSGGMQRRVAIGRALLSTNPKIMLYDEPTTGLDPVSTENVLQLINKLTRERQISTIVVTHQIADAIDIADRYLVRWNPHGASRQQGAPGEGVSRTVFQFLCPGGGEEICLMPTGGVEVHRTQWI
jgi:phospholipid/cholesterol/gamma-HCH transport system ATP-binding protein